LKIPGGDPRGTDREVPAPRDRIMARVPDVLGLPARVAARRIHEAGLRVEWIGTGEARRMTPEAGSILAPGDTVRLVSMRESGND